MYDIGFSVLDDNDGVCIEPVSYTHLDVYKRQEDDGVLLIAKREALTDIRDLREKAPDQLL